jgi:hypothetical protein
MARPNASTPPKQRHHTSLAALAGGALAGGLRRLSLVGMMIDDEGAAAIAGGRLSVLTDLHVCGGRIGDRGLVALATSPGLPALRHLWVWWSLVTDDGIAELARTVCQERGACLRFLSLKHNHLGCGRQDHFNALLDGRPDLAVGFEEHYIGRVDGVIPLEWHPHWIDY